MSEKNNRKRPPVWFILLLLLMLLPLIFWPFMMAQYSGMADSMVDDGLPSRWLIVNIFPIYTLVSCWLSYKCYRQRPEVSYVLIALLALSYIAVKIYI